MSKRRRQRIDRARNGALLSRRTHKSRIALIPSRTQDLGRTLAPSSAGNARNGSRDGAGTEVSRAVHVSSMFRCSDRSKCLLTQHECIHSARTLYVSLKSAYHSALVSALSLTLGDKLAILSPNCRDWKWRMLARPYGHNLRLRGVHPPPRAAPNNSCSSSTFFYIMNATL